MGETRNLQDLCWWVLVCLQLPRQKQKVRRGVRHISMAQVSKGEAELRTTTQEKDNTWKEASRKNGDTKNKPVDKELHRRKNRKPNMLRGRWEAEMGKKYKGLRVKAEDEKSERKSNTHQRDRRRRQEEELSSPAYFVSEKQQTVLEWIRKNYRITASQRKEKMTWNKKKDEKVPRI